jgi:hypothetical protein
VARRIFDLDQDKDVQFDTSDIAGCHRVSITQAAWAAVKPILAKVDVTLVERKEQHIDSPCMCSLHTLVVYLRLRHR